MVNKTTEYTRNIFKTTLVDFIIALERSVRTYSAIAALLQLCIFSMLR